MTTRSLNRAPATWFSKEWPIHASKNPIKDGETIEDWKRRISNMVISKWKGLSESLRKHLVEVSTPRIKGSRHMLPCPKCGNPNTVIHSGVYFRCKYCGTPLVSVKTRRK